ncbi:MAG: hypothetical protein GY716_12905 [bacterium]|nr:hypothetical protein [bacterium]
MRIRATLLILLAAVAAALPARAITDEEIFRDLPFNFINPGGRSLGMGGAFISLADDATAAQANPAGLTTLLSPQFFVEVRAASRDSVPTARGFRDPFLPNEGYDVLVETSSDSVISPSFLSYVYPSTWFSLGISRQEVINISNSTVNRFEFLFGDESDIRSGEGEIDVYLVNWNASAAFKPHDKFRLGLTVSFATLDLESKIVNTYIDPTGNIIGNPDFAGVPLEMYRTDVDDSDSDVTFTAGFLWQVVPQFSIGGVFRQGGDFEFDEVLTARTIDPALIPGTITSRVFLNETDTLVTAENNSFVLNNEFHVPDLFGAGISWKPINGLTLALDASRIEYGDLVEGFDSRLNVLTAGFGSEEDASFTLDDQTNLHLGAEYILPLENKTRRILLRAGFHEDRDNRLRSDFEPGGFGLGSNDNFPGRDDLSHYSLGVGLVLGNNIQLDAAIDLSEIATEGVISMIYKF